MTTALEGGEGSASRPGRSLPPGKTRYPLYRRLCGPQGPVWTGAENLASPGFDPRTVQPLASRYIDSAIPAHKFNLETLNLSMPVPVAARCKARVCGRSPTEIVGSNLTGGMDVCQLCFVLSGKGLCDELITLPEESHRVCVCVCVCVCLCVIEKC